jgi:hypothetical protein
MKKILHTPIKQLLLLLLFTVLLPAACVEQTLITRLTRIIYDWSPELTDRPDNGMLLRLFADNSDTLITVRTPAEGYDGDIPGGNYHLLAFNTDISGAQLTDTASYERATVRALVSVPGTPADPAPRLQTVAPVYAINDPAFAVETRNGVQVFHEPVRVLSDTIQIEVLNYTENDFASFSATLRGAVLSRRLVDGGGNFSEGMGAYLISADFDAVRTASMRVPCLGLFNPAPSGSNYRYHNSIDLLITGRDGRQWLRTMDLSSLLATAMGGADLSPTLQIRIKLTTDNFGNLTVGLQVADWVNGGSTNWTGGN